MVLAITPRHRSVSVVSFSSVASAISLIILSTHVVCGDWVAGRQTWNYSIKSALAGPKAQIELYIPMACEGTDRK
jgi:hypothetical protein